MSDAEEVARLRAWLELFARQNWIPGGRAIPRMAWRALAGEVYEPPPPSPVMVCSHSGCDVTIEEDYFCSFRVITNENEEGYSDVTMQLCEEHAPAVQQALYDLSFRDHTHGGTALLQDGDCPGAKYNDQNRLNQCPTPTDPYKGTYIMGNYELSPGRKGEEDED